MVPQSQRLADRLREHLPRSLLFGVLAYLVGYVLTVVFVLVDGVESSVDAGVITTVGWVFYAAHTVKMEITGFAGERSETGTVNLFEGFGELTSLTDAVPEILYVLVPIVALVGSGFVLVRRVTGPDVTATTAAALGASVVAGYLPLAVVGQLVFSYTETGLGGTVGVTIAPVLLTSVLLVGLVYPLVCGTVGAVLAQQTASDSTEAHRM
ncbi:hypothetical protein [Salinibaculum rarum]|uniref:hypothetical protein n=1 Tax=Salinibaculum rarum TaxID=3058903 RepID=UPI00266052D7|nr:hypothetical protein [Salinibaculum sp. KK48]